MLSLNLFAIWLHSKLLLILLIIVLLCDRTSAKFCYSCAGTCHGNFPCNCQMGVCEADFCFIEKKPTELSGIYRITKGCVKKPARTRSNLIGCDYDHYANHIQCICRGDFCNDAILMRAIPRRNVTCRECSERQPDCDRTCQGQWCHEISVTGNGNQKSGCGYGPPSLPYFYRGNGIPHKYCICNTHLCNDYSRANTLPYFTGLGHKSRSIASSSSSGSYSSGHNRYAPMYECTNCDVTAEDIAVTSSCKQNRCIGHFVCMLPKEYLRAVLVEEQADQELFQDNTTPRLFMSLFEEIVFIIPQLRYQATKQYSSGRGLTKKQGCINVTDNSHIQLGCSHKWMNNEEEELYCACAGDNCNENLQSVSSASLLNSLNSKLIALAFATLMMPFIVAFPSDYSTGNLSLNDKLYK